MTFHEDNNFQQVGRGWFKLPQRINHLGNLVSLYFISNRPSKAPSFAWLPPGPGSEKCNYFWWLQGAGTSVFKEKNLVTVSKKCISKKKQREAPSICQSVPHPSVLQETIPGACDSLWLLRAAIMSPAQANVFHRTCKHPFSFAGHWLKENTLVKFKPSPFSLLLAQHINTSCETLLIYISMDHSPDPHWY